MFPVSVDDQQLFGVVGGGLMSQTSDVNGQALVFRLLLLVYCRLLAERMPKQQQCSMLQGMPNIEHARWHALLYVAG